MAKEVVINGQKVAIKKIDFNAVCELEDLGFSILGLKEKTFGAMRALFAFNAGISLEEAGKQIQEHLKNKGKEGIEDLAPLFEAVAESDFFQSLTE